MEFHLTFPVLRSSESPQQDRRRKPDGTPLRAYTDISFLSECLGESQAKNHEREYIYEAGITCVISGLDHWVWTGYMFLDTYYDKPEAQESVHYYEDLWREEQGRLCQADPLTAGATPLDHAIQQPREYWLRVLKARVHQALQESEIVVSRAKQAIENHVRFYSFFTLSTPSLAGTKIPASCTNAPT